MKTTLLKTLDKNTINSLYKRTINTLFNSQFKTGTDGWSKMTQVLEIDKKYINEINCMKIFANDDKGDNLVDNLKLTIVKNH